MSSSPAESRSPGSVAIVGAAGLVARSIFPYLKQRERFRLLDINAGVLDGTPIHPIDILDGLCTLEALRGVETVVHFAIANYGAGTYEDDNSFPNDYHLRMLDVNIKGSYNLFEASRQLGIKRIVYISSMTVSMGHGRGSDFDEAMGPKPLNLYACTKLFGEQLADVYHRNYGMECFNLRLGHPYPSPLSAEAWKDQWATATLVHFRDIATAVERALTAEGTTQGTYNVLSKNAEGFLHYTRGREIGYEPVEFCLKN